MIRFKQYLSESAQAASTFKDARSIVSYIKSERTKQNYIDALAALEMAAEQKEIYNARFSDHKSAITRGIEYAYRTLFDEIKADVIRSGQETHDLWSMTSAGDIKRITKIFNSMSPKISTAVAFTDAVSGIHDGFKILKGYVKSGKPPAQPKPGQFYKPIASVDATKLALKFMREASGSFSKELKVSVTNQMMGAYEKILTITDPKNLPKDPNTQQVANTIFIVRGTRRDATLELIDGHKARVTKLIDDSVAMVVDRFVAKNSSKLALILQKKDTPKTHKIIKTNINNGMVENTMVFEFNDGSSFVITSSVLFKRSTNGKLFFQYPTRFRDVKMADGSAMKGPSEEKMIKEF